MKASTPVLYIVIPCYNEEEVLPVTAPSFLEKLNQLIGSGKISDDSRVMFVNDGSKDRTWGIIQDGSLYEITITEKQLHRREIRFMP